MFKNYFKIAIRSFLNQKYYSLINTLGLALGTGACILILLFVQDELSYENGFDNHTNIYRLVEDFPMGPNVSQSATVPFPTKNTLLADFPEITNPTFVFRPSSWGGSPIIRLDNEEYFEDNFIFAEHNFLELYDFKFIRGNKKNALTGPDQVILSQTVAKKYFGNDDAIGKRLKLNTTRELEVIGVVEDLSPNTHLQFDMICSFETFRSFFNNQQFFDTNWTWAAAWLYFSVPDEEIAHKIKLGLPAFTKNHFPQSGATSEVTFSLQKADDVHLTSKRELEFKPNGSIQDVRLFAFIAILILIIAIINFMNLATSRSTKRAKEVGIRKVMGAYKKMLIAQFMGEAILTSFLSLLIALGLILLVLPWFNNLTGKQMALNLFHNPQLLMGMVILALITGILAGSYPAFVLSSFQPTEVLKGNAVSKGSGNLLRKILVVSQFVISISLVICIGIVFKQLKYIHNKDMGFSKEQIMIIDGNFRFLPKYGGFKSEVMQNHEIEAVTLLDGSIPGKLEVIENAFVEGGQPEDKQQWFSVMFVGHEFEKVLNVEFLEGHPFQPGSASDSVGYIINESAALALGWNKDVIGRKIDRLSDGRSGDVIGLVKDFHYRPLYETIKPLVIQLGGNSFAIKIHSANLQETVASIEKEWHAQLDGDPFRYSFMDSDFDNLYKKEDTFGKAIKYFSILAIFIASLGLLGLSSYTTEMRKKEIGIRKVNGASTLGLIALLTKDFSILVAIAFVISVPLAYYLGNLWLDNFAYKTEIGFTIFILAGVASLVIALLTVSYHTIRAALSNPINALRHE